MVTCNGISSINRNDWNDSHEMIIYITKNYQELKTKIPSQRTPLSARLRRIKNQIKYVTEISYLCNMDFIPLLKVLMLPKAQNHQLRCESRLPISAGRFVKHLTSIHLRHTFRPITNLTTIARFTALNYVLVFYMSAVSRRTYKLELQAISYKLLAIRNMANTSILR